MDYQFIKYRRYHRVYKGYFDNILSGKIMDLVYKGNAELLSYMGTFSKGRIDILNSYRKNSGIKLIKIKTKVI